MTDLQTRTEQMGEGCLQYLDLSGNSAFLTGVLLTKRNALETTLNKISDLELIQELDITGNAEQKKSFKQLMCEAAFPVGRNLLLWAKDTGNDTLKNAINYRFYQLYNVKDSTSQTRCQTIYDNAKALVAAPPSPPPVFADYNLTAGANALLLTAINNFKNSLGTPKSAKAVTVAATSDIDHAFGDLDENLLQIDHSIDTLRFTNASYWEGWKAAYKRDDTGVRHQSARIYLIDDATSAKIGQGTVSLPELNLNKKVTKFSLATFKDAETGIGSFNVLAKADLYLDQAVPNLVIEEGKLTRLIVRMKKA